MRFNRQNFTVRSGLLEEGAAGAQPQQQSAAYTAGHGD